MNIVFNSYPHGKKKALTMSYDDGQIHDRRLVGIFNKYGIKGSFHLNSGKFDEEQFVKSSEIKELYSGHEVSAHSLTHPWLVNLPESLVVAEIMEDRKRLEHLVGYPVRGMSYPFGAYHDDLLGLLPGLGIEYARTVNSHGGFHLPGNFLAWHPTCHHNNNLIEKCRAFLDLPSWAQMPLFYVWGHSFEFERQNNWDMIEEFCKMVSGCETVWYATNIEIMDYIKALRGLRFSADKRMVLNPSATAVWIEADGQDVKIEPGKIVYL